MLEVEDLWELRRFDLEFLSINGGEPCLHPRILDILDYSSRELKPSMLLLCTNGSVHSVLERVVERFPNLAISISFDGINSHDRVRGVAGAFKNIERDIEILQSFQGRKIFSFTCQDINKYEIVDSYKFAVDNGFEFDFRFVDDNILYGSSSFHWDPRVEEQFSWLIENEADLAKKLFYNGYLNKPDFTCLAGVRFAYLLPDKNFYPCLRIKQKIGDLYSGIMERIDCRLSCWVDCYFYDNFHRQLKQLDCIDTRSKCVGSMVL
jgi:MoaA/NifB/PqqE/SkfB family radical SAM enzyme